MGEVVMGTMGTMETAPGRQGLSVSQLDERSDEPLHGDARVWAGIAGVSSPHLANDPQRDPAVPGPVYCRL